MGLLIHTSFDTPEGIPVSNVYCRITGLVVDFLSSTEVRVLIKYDTFISREKRLVGARSLKVPGMTEYITILVPPTDTWGSLPYLYAALKSHLEGTGLTVEDVLECTPAPEPAPAPAPAPAPEPAPDA